MRARKTHVALFTGFILVILFIAAIGPVAMAVAASPGGDKPVQPVRQSGCTNGIPDGVCESQYGENPSNCPQDCVATATVQVTPTSVEATATEQPPIIKTEETATPEASVPTATPTPLLPPDEGEEEPTQTPTTMPPSEGLTIADFFPGLVNEACSPITFGDLPDTTKEQYYEIAVEDYHAPDDLEVINCTGQLGTTTICFPVREATGLVEAAEGFYSRIGMLNCTSAGCEIVPRQGTRVGDRICYDILAEDEVTCSIGCVLAPLGANVPVGVQQGGLNRAIIIGSIIAVIIVIGIAIFLLVGGGLFGAASDDDKDEED